MLPGFPFQLPGMMGGGAANGGGGLGGLSALGLPPALDGGLKALSLLVQYGSLMRQLLNDAMLFLFVNVLANALVQLTWAERVHYVIQ